MTSIPTNVPTSRMTVLEPQVSPNAVNEFCMYFGPINPPNPNEDVDLTVPEMLVVETDDYAYLANSEQMKIEMVNSLDAEKPKTHPQLITNYGEQSSVDMHEQHAISEINGLIKRDVVTTPWKLLPGYRLSYSITEERGIKNELSSTNPIYELSIRSSNELAQFKSAIQTALMERRTLNQPDVVIARSSRAIDEPDYDSIREMADSRISQALNPSTSQWIKQLFHLTSTMNGQHTVWIRDYALTQDEINEVISNIMSAAVKCSVQLERIMVNGHEMWSRQTASKQDGGDVCK
jgi:Txe/YoeB family toxin of Txe-Axe toxin-antitoxin module